MAAGVIAMGLGFIGKLAALVNTIPLAVTGGLAIYLFGVIGKQGVALIQSEKVNLFDPSQLAIGASILIFIGIGGNLSLKDGLFPFPIPVLFPNGIPAIIFRDRRHPDQPPSSDSSRPSKFGRRRCVRTPLISRN